jgi:hypothetical protein
LALQSERREIEHAVLVTLEPGVRTGDTEGALRGSSTTDFVYAIIGNIDRISKRAKPHEFKRINVPQASNDVSHVSRSNAQGES